MSRNRRSAKAAGARFEKLVADFLGTERRAKAGKNDAGDIAGVKAGDERVVLECKDCTRLDLPGWWREVEREAGNDHATYGAIIHKRRGVAHAAHQWVTMDLQTFKALLDHINQLEEWHND